MRNERTTRIGRRFKFNVRANEANECDEKLLTHYCKMVQEVTNVSHFIHPCSSYILDIGERRGWMCARDGNAREKGMKLTDKY